MPRFNYEVHMCPDCSAELAMHGLVTLRTATVGTDRDNLRTVLVCPHLPLPEKA